MSKLYLFKEINIIPIHFSVMQRDFRSGGNNSIDQQTQTPVDGVSNITLRTQLKNATRNIKNRWSSSGADAAVGMTGMIIGSEESQSLLSGAGDLPNETPTHLQHQPLDMIINRNMNPESIPPPPYPTSPTSSPSSSRYAFHK